MSSSSVENCHCLTTVIHQYELLIQHSKSALVLNGSGGHWSNGKVCTGCSHNDRLIVCDWTVLLPQLYKSLFFCCLLPLPFLTPSPLLSLSLSLSLSPHLFLSLSHASVLCISFLPIPLSLSPVRISFMHVIL